MSNSSHDPNPEFFRQLETLFGQAMDLPREDRQGFVERACPRDPELRAKLLTMLDATRESEGLMSGLDPALVSDALKDVLDSERAGQSVGVYTIERELGRGGMGTVYLANRSDGQFDQRVALKIVKRGMDTDAILRSFLRERQILAWLRHDNIAQLFDGGIAEDGRPYFAMEYVEGTPLTVYCEEKELDLEARLRLFRSACAAVQYAHRSLIIHRDLKPSNILVSDAGEVKLLDFGIAKLLDNRAVEGTVTQFAKQAMTPDYAAPEQIRYEPVTTGTDIYALGVILYELLAGRRPFDFTDRNPVDIVRVVTETNAMPPSRVAHGRGRRRLEGDLDTIALKAMHKEIDRRYPSVEALSDDIGRHLDGQPVLARGDSVGYRFSKFLRRNTLAVAGGVGLVLLLAGFALSTTLQSARTSRERDRAHEVRDFVTSLFESANPLVEIKGDRITARDLLERGADRIESELRAQPELQAEMWSVVGNAFLQLGRHERAEELFSRALEVRREHLDESHEDVAQSLAELGDAKLALGDPDVAEELYQQALAIRRGLFRVEDPIIAESIQKLGLVSNARGSGAEAEARFREALSLRRGLYPDGHPDVAESLHNVGLSLRYQSKDAEAEPFLREALAVYDQVYPDGHPTVAPTLTELAMALAKQGDLDQAEELAQRALVLLKDLLGDDHPGVANGTEVLAWLAEQGGDYDRSEALWRETLAIQRAHHGEDHPRVVTAKAFLASLLSRQGNYEEAQALSEEVLAARRARLSEDHSDLLASINNMGRIYRLQGEYDDAERLFREVLAIKKKHFPEKRASLALTTNNLAVVLRHKGDLDAALQVQREAVDTWVNALGEDHPRVCFGYQNLGHLYRMMGRYDEAQPLYEKTVEIWLGHYGEKHPRTALSWTSLAWLFVDLQRYEDAEPLLRQALAVQEEVLPPEHLATAETRVLLGACLSARGAFDEAETLLLSGFAVLEKGRGVKPQTRRALEFLAEHFGRRGIEAQRKVYLSWLEATEG